MPVIYLATQMHLSGHKRAIEFHRLLVMATPGPHTAITITLFVLYMCFLSNTVHSYNPRLNTSSYVAFKE